MGSESSRPKREMASSKPSNTKADLKSIPAVNKPVGRSDSQHSARDSLSRVLSRGKKEPMGTEPSHLPKSSLLTNVEPETGVGSGSTLSATKLSIASQPPTLYQLSLISPHSSTAEKEKEDMGGTQSHHSQPSSSSNTTTELGRGSTHPVNNRPGSRFSNEQSPVDVNDEKIKKAEKEVDHQWAQVYGDELAGKKQEPTKAVPPPPPTTAKKFASSRAELMDILVGPDDRSSTFGANIGGTGKADPNLEKENRHKAVASAAPVLMPTTKEDKKSSSTPSFPAHADPPLHANNINRESSAPGSPPPFPPKQIPLPALPPPRAKTEQPTPAMVSALTGQKFKANSSHPASSPTLAKPSILLPRPHIPSRLAQSSFNPQDYSNPYSSSSPFQALAAVTFGEKTCAENRPQQYQACSVSEISKLHPKFIKNPEESFLDGSAVQTRAKSTAQQNKDFDRELQHLERNEDMFIQTFEQGVKEDVAARAKVKREGPQQSMAPFICEIFAHNFEYMRAMAKMVIIGDSEIRADTRAILTARQNWELDQVFERVRELGTEDVFIQKAYQGITEDRAKSKDKGPGQGKPPSVSETSEIDHEYFKKLAESVIEDEDIRKAMEETRKEKEDKFIQNFMQLDDLEDSRTEKFESAARYLMNDSAALARVKNKLSPKANKELDETLQIMKESDEALEELKESIGDKAPALLSSLPTSEPLPSHVIPKSDIESLSKLPDPVSDALALRIKELEQASPKQSIKNGAAKPSRTLREEYAQMTSTSRKHRGGKARLDGLLDRIPKDCYGPGVCKNVLCDHLYGRS
jgi:hypothetical protein